MPKHVKNDKSNTNIADVCLQMLNKIHQKLTNKSIDLTKVKCSFTISIVTSDECPYCHDAIVAVQRTFHAYGWNCLMTHYARRENKEKNIVNHGFVFSFSKKNEHDNDFSNLPF